MPLRRLIAASLLAAALLAQEQVDPEKLPPQLRKVGIDQKLNSQVPMDAVFADEDGNRKPLREFMRSRPAVLALVYYECPMLCTMILNGLLKAVRVVPLGAGADYDIIAVSFDPSETPQLARAKKHEYVQRYHRAGGENGWRFLTGDAENIARLTSAVGYRTQRDDKSNQWSHASGIMILTPEGRLSKYFYGVEYSARDLRLGLVEASRGRIGSPVDQVLLFCFHYDPSTGKYSLLILRLLRVCAAATVLGLLAFWWFSYRSRRKGNNDVQRLPAIS